MAGRSGLCRNLAPHRNYVVSWIDDAVDLTGERLEGGFLFGVVGVAVIRAANPANDVPKAAFGVVGGHPCPAHKRSAGSAQVVDCPPADATGFVKKHL